MIKINKGSNLVIRALCSQQVVKAGTIPIGIA